MVITIVNTHGRFLGAQLGHVIRNLIAIGITCGNIPLMEAIDLQKRREALGLSREELARELSTTVVTVWRWENSERGIPPYLELALQTIERTLAVKKTNRSGRQESEKNAVAPVKTASNKK